MITSGQLLLLPIDNVGIIPPSRLASFVLAATNTQQTIIHKAATRVRRVQRRTQLRVISLDDNT